MRFAQDVLIQSLQEDLGEHVDPSAPSWAPDNSPLQVACYRLRESLVKKFNQELHPSAASCRAAMEKFMAVNERMLSWKLELNHVQPDWELVSMLKLELKEFLDPSNLGPIYSDYTRMFDLGYSGPGASIGALGCDFYTKMFGSRLTSNRHLSDVWSMLIERNEQLRVAYSDPTGISGVSVADHNKLSFVNKNQDVARTICTEPSVNMWMQLGLGRILALRLKGRYGIDFTRENPDRLSQPDVNKSMARLASTHDHLATFDLESASDSMGLRMLEEMLPKKFFSILLKLRSPTSRLPDGSSVELGMVSTMGNGFTFPLQTLFFAAACVVVLRYLGIPVNLRGPIESRTMSVFGDDIIIDKRCARLLRALLEKLGFVVNENKTFVEGPFRESCGGDYFNGVDVRPVYLKSLRSLQDIFVAVNRLNYWTAKTGVSLRNTVSYVLQLKPGARRCPVPPDEADDSGVITPRRFLDCTSRYVPRSFGLLRYVASKPIFYGYKVDTDNGRLIGHRKKVPFNPRGLYVAFLGGYVSGYRDRRTQQWVHRVSLRQDLTRYITKRMCTPSWGHMRPDILSEFPDRVARLNTAFGLNM